MVKLKKLKERLNKKYGKSAEDQETIKRKISQFMEEFERSRVRNLK